MEVLKVMNNYKLLEKLSEIEGMSIEKMLESAVCDGVSPGICTECEETREVEPDCATGYCENCQRNTVVSALMLADNG